MLTDYMVRCPHPGCGYHGGLFPRGNREAWKPALPGVREVIFDCPRCQREWHARVVGDDVKPLPLPELTETH